MICTFFTISKKKGKRRPWLLLYRINCFNVFSQLASSMAFSVVNFGVNCLIEMMIHVRPIKGIFFTDNRRIVKCTMSSLF